MACVETLILLQLREKLQQRLRFLAEQEAAEPLWEKELSAKRTELNRLDADLEKVAHNLALSDDQQQHKAIAKVFEQLNDRRGTVASEITELASRSERKTDVAIEVDAAMGVLKSLIEAVADRPSGTVAREIFDLANARLFLRFGWHGEGGF